MSLLHAHDLAQHSRDVPGQLCALVWTTHGAASSARLSEAGFLCPSIPCKVNVPLTYATAAQGGNDGIALTLKKILKLDPSLAKT